MRMTCSKDSKSAVKGGDAYHSSPAIPGLHGGGKGVSAFFLTSKKSRRRDYLYIGGKANMPLLRLLWLEAAPVVGLPVSCSVLLPLTVLTVPPSVLAESRPTLQSSLKRIEVCFGLGCSSASMRT